MPQYFVCTRCNKPNPDDTLELDGLQRHQYCGGYILEFQELQLLRQQQLDLALETHELQHSVGKTYRCPSR